MYKRLEGLKTVKRKITIQIPTEGEGHQKATMFLVFEIQSRSVNDARMAAFQAGDPDTDWLNDCVKGWDGYMEADGKTPIEFSVEELKTFLDVPYQRAAAVMGYFEAANGGGGQRKNS